jgi:alkylated DNA repair dioxygenase AlkB
MEKINITDKSWYMKKGIYSSQGTQDNHVLKNNKEIYKKLWELCPKTYDTVIIFNNEVPMPRYSQSFGNPYYYSGKVHEVKPVPEVLKPFKEFVNELGLGEFNQVLVNWYENGHHYIGKHRDNESQFEDKSPIVSISLGAERTFRIRSYKDLSFSSNDKIISFKQNEIIKDIKMSHGLLLVMGGEFQKELTHEVPKINGKKGLQTNGRINITFRKFT